MGCVCCVWGSSPPPPQAAHLSFSTTQAGLPPVGRGTCFQWSNRAQSSTHSAERGFPSSCQATHAQQQQPHHSPLRGWLCESWRPPQLFFQVPFWAGSTTSPTAERQTEACERDTGLLLCLDCILSGYTLSIDHIRRTSQTCSTCFSTVSHTLGVWVLPHRPHQLVPSTTEVEEQTSSPAQLH